MPPAKPGAVRPVIDDGDDRDIAVRMAPPHGVQKPPISREILHVQVVETVLTSERARDSVLLHAFAVKAVGEQNGLHRTPPPGGRTARGIRAPRERTHGSRRFGSEENL